MYVSGVNIAVTYPDTQKVMAALKSLDFLSVASHMMTPTSELADIVLPKTTGLEEEEVSLEPSAHIVCYTNPVIEPQNEARSDFDFTTDLARRLEIRGINTRKYFPWESKQEFNEYLLGDEIDWKAFKENGWAPFEFKLGNFEEAGFKTPSGKIELWSETLNDLGTCTLAGTICAMLDRYELEILTAGAATIWPITPPVSTKKVCLNVPVVNFSVREMRNCLPRRC